MNHPHNKTVLIGLLTLTIVSAIFFAGALPAHASRRPNFNELVRMKEAQLKRFNASFIVEMQQAVEAYNETLTTLQAEDQPDALRTAARIEQERFAQARESVPKPESGLPDEINAARNKLISDQQQAESTLRRRRIGVLNVHIRQLEELLQRIAPDGTVNPQAASIREEIDNTRRQIAELKFSDPED